MAGSSRTPGSHSSEDVKSKAHQDAASSAAGKAKDAASSATQKAQDFASNVGQRAQDAASSATRRAQDMASGASQRAEETISSVGERMSTLAGTIRERAPHEGAMGTAASTVADTLQAGGQYLQQHGLEDMAGDLTSMVRRFPMQSVLVGLGVGFLLGQTFSRR